MSKRIVNIIGYAPSAYNSTDVGENWVVNHAWKYGMRVDKWFLMDGFDAMRGTLASQNIPEEEFMDWIKGHYSEMELISAHAAKLDITSPDNTKIQIDIKNFPLKEASQLIPGTFFNNSIVYMLAYAAIQEKLGFPKVDIVNLYGIELWISPDKSEYNYQRPCIDFWIPLLNGMGIQIMIPAYLLYAKDIKDNLYGYVQ